MANIKIAQLISTINGTIVSNSSKEVTAKKVRDVLLLITDYLTDDVLEDATLSSEQFDI
jgi:hypothetical protein